MREMKKLRAAMVMHDITQEDLARRWGTSRTYVSRRMLGKYSFTVWEVYDLCGLLEISLDKLPEYFPQKPVKEWKAI